MTVDIRQYPYIEIVETYTRSGTHLGEVCKTPDGRVVWESGPDPSKDKKLFFYIDEMIPWRTK